MKTISIRPPWPGLIVAGLKDIESRTWKTSYRGPLAIHASLTVDKQAMEILRGYSFKVDQLAVEPNGTIIAVCDLIAIKEYKKIADFLRDYDRHLCRGYARYGWVLENVKALQTPIPWKGKLGLWEFPAEPIMF